MLNIFAFKRKIIIVMVSPYQAAKQTSVSTDANQAGKSNHTITIQRLYPLKNQMNNSITKSY